MWGVAYSILFRPSPRILHAWRIFLLRAFGAQIGKQCRLYPKAEIWAPWNLICEDIVTVGDGANLYNPATITLRSHCVVSQDAYLCSATHDYQDPTFPLVVAPIEIGGYAWICSKATVQMGVVVGKGAVLALGAIATKNLDAWTVYGGIPAKKIGERNVVEIDA